MSARGGIPILQNSPTPGAPQWHALLHISEKLRMK